MSTENRPEDYLRNFKEGINDFGNKVNQMVDDFLKGEEGGESKVRAAADVFETESHYIIEIELPGFNKENIKTQVVDGILILKGTKNFAEGADQNLYLRRERRFGEFMRSFELPEYVLLKDIKAGFDNGVLSVRFVIDPEKKDPNADIEIG